MKYYYCEECNYITQSYTKIEVCVIPECKSTDIKELIINVQK
jgi:RNA polymerase subunit RPABC4/transcription elongation factor Spt4